MRTTQLLVITDIENKNSREILSQLDGSLPILQIPIQRAKSILPGISATPAIGVLYWSSDLQGALADIKEFNTYITQEEQNKQAIQDALALAETDINEELAAIDAEESPNV